MRQVSRKAKALDNYSQSNLPRWTEICRQKHSEKDHDAQYWNYYLGPSSGDLSSFFGNSELPKPLLHIEMEYAATREECLPQQEERQTATLVILVGDSFEPLLQAIWAYRPQRIVPVVNLFYGDRDEHDPNHAAGSQQWRKLHDLIKRLPFIVPDLPRDVGRNQTYDTVHDDPSAVFEFLNKHLRADLGNQNRRIVIDITGAKKTMVAGAFLFAAYTGTDISYVDFDSYDGKARRPYGYSCRIGTVSNPFVEWRLRDWMRAAELYRQHDFTGALNVLPTALWAGAPDAWKQGFTQLHQCIELLAEWENGHLYPAKGRWQALPGELQEIMPTAIGALGEYWPEEGSSHTQWISVDFLATPRLLLIFGRDELARAQRLSDHSQLNSRLDYRAAFVRAYALHETLYKARVLALYRKGCLEEFEERPTASNFPKSGEPDKTLDRLLHKMTGGDAQPLLKTRESKKLRLRIRCQDVPADQPAPSDLAPEQIEDLRVKRNLIIHTYVPVSPDDAARAIRLAHVNLKNYVECWGKWIDPTFDLDEVAQAIQLDAPTWQQLLQTCGADFVPQTSLQKEAA